MLERLISGVTWLLVGGFTAAWLAIMLSVAVAAALPIMSFAMTIAAGLVVYAVRNAAAGTDERGHRETLILR